MTAVCSTTRHLLWKSEVLIVSDEIVGVVWLSLVIASLCYRDC